MKTIDNIIELMEKVRKTTPLVHNITNYVTVNDCANIQLAIGGSPIMSDEIEDVVDITKICSALVINIGTLNARTISSMKKSCLVANENNIPIVLDPVGCGASKLRSETTMELLNNFKFSAIRGNLSELSFIAGQKSSTKGVDSSDDDLKNDAVTIAKTVAKKYGCGVGITGETDIITDGVRVFKIFNGTAIMKQITGTGCMISALCGVFLGASASGYEALCASILTMSLSGELANAVAGGHGTGSLRVKIIDKVSTLTKEEILKEAKIDEKNN